MTKHLHDMDIDTVSLVDKGANGKRFAVLKTAGRTPMVSLPSDPVITTEPVDDTPAGLMQRLTKALGLDGEDVAAEDAISAAVREHETVTKAGRKISGARLAQLKGAHQAIGDLINGVEAGYWTPPEASGVAKAAEVDDMTEQELTELVAKMTGEGIAAAFGEDGAATTAIAKALVDAKPTEDATPDPKPVEGATADASDADVATALVEVSKRLDEIGATQGDTIAAVAKLLDRTNALESGRRQSSAGEPATGEATITKREGISRLHGILG